MSLPHGWIRFENHQIHPKLIISLLYFQELKLQKVQELTKIINNFRPKSPDIPQQPYNRASGPTKLYKVT